MKICIATLENVPGSPYSQSGFTDHVVKNERESHEDFDARVWREHCTCNAEGQVCVPAMGLKMCVDSAAYKLGEKVPGRRGATYRNFFASGFFVEGDMPIANGKVLTKDDAEMVAIMSDSSGKRNASGGSRVKRRFPIFKQWSGTARFVIIDDIITKEVFEHHLKSAGLICGIGRFRPENGGSNGRFRVTKITWEEVPL
jgi:hypothetical protein